MLNVGFAAYVDVEELKAMARIRDSMAVRMLGYADSRRPPSLVQAAVGIRPGQADLMDVGAAVEGEPSSSAPGLRAGGSQSRATAGRA